MTSRGPGSTPPADPGRPHGEAPQGFGPRWRLHQRREFLRVQNQGRKFVTEHFLFFSLPNGLDRPRLGITVSRKVGKAIVRNRVKRLVREVFRKDKASFPAGKDIVVIARVRASSVRYEQVQAELEAYRRRPERRRRSRSGGR